MSALKKGYVVDEEGTCWYVSPSGSRKRAFIKTCPGCQREYQIADPRQVYCGHPCAAQHRHARGKITTPSTAGSTGSLLNSDNPRYSKDESGQWWYKPQGTKEHARTRAYVKVCTRCGSEYLSNIFHRKEQNLCSRRCALLTFREAFPDRFKGEGGSNWKGGRRKDPRGYILVWAPDHPSRANTKKPYVLEHRLVMEKILGRYLEPNENVHHVNGIRDDNRPENLELWSKAQPPGQRVEDKVLWARDLLQQHGYDIMKKAV